MTFSELWEKIEQLKELSGVEYFLIGHSTLNQPIYAFHVGSYEGPQIIIDGGMHAREYISTLFLVEEIKYLSEQQLDGGYYIIPLVNPDGVRLVLDGVEWVECEILRDILLLINQSSADFSQWKANAMGVDLNVNFDALWGEGLHNVFCPASENFVGYYPNSERENINLINFTYQVMPDAVLSYHSKGEVIFYGFESLSDELLQRDFVIAKDIAGVTGYQVERTVGSVGAYADWVSYTLGVPAFTVEVGSPDLPHPITEEQLQVIFEQNKLVPETTRLSLDYVSSSFL